MYLTISRPDIQFSTCLCARYQANPKESHLIAVKRIFKYLKGTPSLGLWKSTSGACQLLRGKLVSWSAKKHQSIAMSSAEAEYVAPAGCYANILWMKILHSRTKHIDIRYHFIRDHILKGDIELHFIPNQYQLADIFTKPLDDPTFKRLIVELELTINPTQVFNVHNWTLKPSQPKEPPFTAHMKAIYNLDVPMDSKASDSSLQTKEVPQGKKPGAKSGLRRKQSSKHTSESKTEASISKTSQLEKDTQSSLAKDKSPSHPSPPTLMVDEIHKEAQQAAGGPTSLGATSKQGDHPQLISDSPPNEPIIVSDESKEEVATNKGTEATSHDVPKDTSVPPPSSLKLAQIQELMAQVHLLYSWKKEFATVVKNASGAISMNVPSAGQAAASPTKGEKNTKDADTNLKDELIDLLGKYVVIQEDGFNKVILNLKVSDLHLAEWIEVLKACPDKSEKGWKTIYDMVKTRVDQLTQTEQELKIDLNQPLKEQDPLKELIDLANKK
ncbi:hypothetical protein Tco_1246360 [Tanacetum coccineum]